MSPYRQKQRLLPAGYACVRLDEINIIILPKLPRLANPANSDLSRGFSDVHRRGFQGGYRKIETLFEIIRGKCHN
jgi:hypothetical protein